MKQVKFQKFKVTRCICVSTGGCNKLCLFDSGSDCTVRSTYRH